MGTLRTGAIAISFVFGAIACGGGSKPAASASDSSSDKTVEVGAAAPDLSIQTVNNKGKVSLESLQGKVVVVDFWATWCGPCKQSFPKLEELSKKYSGKVEVVGISCDDESKEVPDFAKNNGATFAIGWDEGHALAKKWGVSSMPTTFLVDATGKVRYVHAGYHDDEAEKIGKELSDLSNEPSTKGAKDTAVASSDKDKDSATAKDATKDSATTTDATKDSATASTDTDAAPAPTTKTTKKPGKKGTTPKKTGTKPKKTTTPPASN